ncbi:MAG: Hsp20/alpha crystallin family protein [Thermodesulfobacteriota bacterium]
MIQLKIVKDSLNKELESLLDQVFYHPHPRVCAHGQTWLPQIDIYETEEGFQVVAELPGSRPEDIEVVVDHRHLKLAGRRRPRTPENSYLVHQSEIIFGEFRRIFRMPSFIVPDRTEAALDHGILTILLIKDRAVKTTVEIL